MLNNPWLASAHAHILLETDALRRGTCWARLCLRLHDSGLPTAERLRDLCAKVSCTLVQHRSGISTML